MKYRSRTLCGFVAALATGLVVSLPALAAPLSEAEINKQIINKTIEFSSGNAAGKVKFSKNGKSRLWATNYSVKKDKGTWRLKGNRMCTTWEVTRKGKESCHTISKISDGKYKNSDGVQMTVN